MAVLAAAVKFCHFFFTISTDFSGIQDVLDE
jgi:hypothetical protein